MNEAPHTNDPAAAAHGGSAGHGHEPHSPWLAHHFDTPAQQFASSKLGMWLFLLTEVLFFSGLFCAYAVFRRTQPELFIDGHHFLDTNLGAINTAVLLFSSLTMAWAVRAAQLNQRRLLPAMLAVTMVCAFVFLGIKYVEYKSKWDHHLFPSQARIAYALGLMPDEYAMPERSFQPDLAYIEKKLSKAEGRPLSEAEVRRRGENLASFFGIYFALTGLHAIHVILGIAVIGWIFVRSLKGHFSSRYFEPVDCVGLYWHLVDLIWIFLFPLLYLIH